MLSLARRAISSSSSSSQTSLLRKLSTCTVPVGGHSSNYFDLFNPSEEHAALRSMLRTFVEREVEPQALAHNRNETFNTELFQRLGSQMGILGLTVDEQYGGSGFQDASAVAIVHEELSASDPAFCLSYLAHSVLFTHNLSINGNHEQKLKYLPDVCSGVKVSGMCMSEPDAGTDVLGMSTTARHDEGNDTFVLNGRKMWITNGTIDGVSTGDLFLVYARTGPNRADLTQFVVEKGMPGFSLGQKIEDKCGMRASMTAELVFEDVVLPRANVVGAVNQATLCMMRNLEIERIALAAMSLGIAKRCIEDMNSYAQARKAFGKQLFEFGQIQKNVTESYAQYMAGRSYVYNVARNIELNCAGNGLDADGVKLFCGDMAKTVADRAIQTMGGYGYVGEYVVERLWRDSKLLEIGGGTNESHHKNMMRDLRRTVNKID
mmetsp:Transcript_12374/g.18559  ORF Transcript_12374/g.18559 Transcript_12374/m.18559 type:complete len:434 (-) Transcript_12374:364-1665(-)